MKNLNNIIFLGESDPITKSPPSSIEEFFYSSASHKHHTLYCGTKILQSRFYAGAQVCKSTLIVFFFFLTFVRLIYCEKCHVMKYTQFVGFSIGS